MEKPEARRKEEPAGRRITLRLFSGATPVHMPWLPPKEGAPFPGAFAAVLSYSLWPKVSSGFRDLISSSRSLIVFSTSVRAAVSTGECM